MKYLLDASSLILLIKKADVKTTIECLQDSLILDLTFYEVGNAVWKEGVLLKYLTPEEAKRIGTIAQTVLAKIGMVTNIDGDFQKILEIAQNEKLSFYDSSYVFFAKQRGLFLVTEDKKLEMKAKKHVAVRTITTLFPKENSVL
jgi:predicted nucleic acid-binding protein